MTREFLLSLFSYGSGGVSKFARARGVPRETVRDRKRRLLKVVREKFFEKNLRKPTPDFSNSVPTSK